MKKILNKLLIIFIMLLLVFPVSASSPKRIITPVLYNNSSGQLEYRLYDEASTLTITDGSISDRQRTHLYAYGKTYCRPWEVSLSSEECRLDYDGQWSYLAWTSQNVNVGSTETDYALADSGMTLLVNSYNDVINFYNDWGREWVPYVDSGNRGSVGDLYTLFTNKSLTIADWTIKLETNITPTETELKSLEKTVKRSSISTDDVQYARISVTSPSSFADLIKGYETSKVVIWGINKPYNVGKKEYITLEGLCQYATVAAEINENDDVDYKPGLFADAGAFEQFETVSATEEAVNGIFGGITTTLTKIVGFDEPEDLIFSNQSNTYLGMMPQSWWEASNTMFWFFEVIAILVLFASVINSAIKQSMASISPSIRNTLKDSIANLGIAIVLLILYAPMFYILAKVNSMLVTTLSSFANEMGVTLANTVNPVTKLGSTMINIILDLLLFFINAGLIVKINLDYFIRSITIMLLHVMAPVAIASISFDSKKALFNNWLKELTGNIFMQSFNALVLAMIMIILKGGTVHWWYYQAALFAIASLNSWFMKMFGLHNSVAEMAGSVHDQGKQAFNEAKKNAGNAVAFAGMAAGGLQNSGIMSGGSSGGVPGGATSGSAGSGSAGGGGAGEAAQGGNLDARNPKNENKDDKKFKTKMVGNAMEVTKMNTPNADSENTGGEQNSSPDQLGVNTDKNAQGSNSNNNEQSGSMSNQTPQRNDKTPQEGNKNLNLGQSENSNGKQNSPNQLETNVHNKTSNPDSDDNSGQDRSMSNQTPQRDDKTSQKENESSNSEQPENSNDIQNSPNQPEANVHNKTSNPDSDDNGGQSGSVTNQTPQKDDKISKEGNNNMSLGQKVKKTASVFAAAAAATYSRNDYIKQGAAEYLGYDKGMDKKGEKGYFGYQPFGTANNNISKESQQKKHAEEVAKRREEEEKQEREQREISEKIDMILELEQENQQNNNGTPVGD